MKLSLTDSLTHWLTGVGAKRGSISEKAIQMLILGTLSERAVSSHHSIKMLQRSSHSVRVSSIPLMFAFRMCAVLCSRVSTKIPFICSTTSINQLWFCYICRSVVPRCSCSTILRISNVFLLSHPNKQCMVEKGGKWKAAKWDGLSASPRMSPVYNLEPKSIMTATTVGHSCKKNKFAKLCALLAFIWNSC